MVGYGKSEVKPMNGQRIKHDALSSTGNGMMIDDYRSRHRDLVTMEPIVRQLVNLPVLGSKYTGSRWSLLGRRQKTAKRKAPKAINHRFTQMGTDRNPF